MSTLKILAFGTVLGAVSMFAAPGTARAGEGRIQVVTTLTDYAAIARAVGGDRVDAKAICAGDQDAHFVRPKPSYAVWVSRADLFITTGMDLEMWAPAVLDKAANAKVMEGQEGYVSASAGVHLLEIPDIKDRGQGGVHIYGNPHLHTNPLNLKVVARNIATGLAKVDPAHAAEYRERAKAFADQIDRRMFGPDLIPLLGAETLEKLALSGNLIPFLSSRSYKGKPMLDLLGGWMRQAMPLRGRQIATYHKNWVYFARVFGLEVVGEVEPKPGIPPSPKHVEDLIRRMKERRIPVILAANYFDEDKVRHVAAAVDATPVIVPMYVGGVPGVDDYFDLVDFWISHLVRGFADGSRAGAEVSR